MGIALVTSPWQTTGSRVNHCHLEFMILDDFLGGSGNHPIGLQIQTFWQPATDKAPSMRRNATQLVAFVVYSKIQHGQERLLKITHQLLICDLHWSHKIRRRLIQCIDYRQIAYRHGNTIVNVIIQRVGQELDQDGALILAAKHRKSGPAIDGL
ncbi:hypothetical protein CK621_00185 [Vandammella animalimorsus]|uniref:Uncharacterized protein n=1 Tax=Vandammella animalimorsus TaxID=2029117 RepID=A0A2A2AZQ7_9BURK|nr:hypothetical protein CK621_00185 [Vandammella animalimorsus]